MRTILVLLVWLSLISTSYAQGIIGSVAPNSPPAPHHRITGTVTNAITGEPIRRALVQVSGANSSGTLTGPDGRFVFDNIPEGPVNFTVEKPGFFDPRSFPQSDFAPPAPLMSSDSGNNDFVLKLFPAAQIVGVVTDSDGEPIEHAPIQVWREQILQGHKQWQQAMGSGTDDDGGYDVDNLIPGTYAIYAGGHVRPPVAWNTPREIYAPTWYPDSADRDAAQRITLQAGQEVRADFHLSRTRAFRVTGTLGGYPSASAIFPSVLDANNQSVQVTIVNIVVDSQHGRFSGVFPPGRWTLNFAASDTHGTQYSALQDIAINGSDITNLQIQLRPSSSTSIPVTISHSDQQPQLSIGGSQQNPGFTAMLLPVRGSFGNQYWMGRQKDSDPLGFQAVPPGEYKLEVQSYGTECLDSAWSGNIDLTRQYLTITAGGVPQPIAIKLRSDCGSLTSRIDDSEEKHFGYLVVTSNSTLMEPKVFPVNKAANSGLAMTLSPGSYEVYGFSSLEGLEYANPQVLQQYAGQSVQIDAGQRVGVTVKLADPKVE